MNGKTSHQAPFLIFMNTLYMVTFKVGKVIIPIWGVVMGGRTYTIKEFSRITGYSVNTIRGYIRSNKLRAQLVDGVYQIDQDEAEKFLEARKKLVVPVVLKLALIPIPA